MNSDTRAQEIHKLLEQSKTKGVYYDRQRVTNRYALERFLFRLGQSAHVDNFILKGALLLAIYVPDANRPSKDADFQLRGVFSPDGAKSILQGICSIEHDDGLTFDIEGITVMPVGADREYPGYSAKIPTRLGLFNCSIHLDIGFGDAITPAPVVTGYPSLLPLPRPRVKVYPISTFIAEKFQALVNLGMSNSRLKDFYDLSTIADYCDLNGEQLQNAILATFGNRKTSLPTDKPIALTSTYYNEPGKIRERNAFLKRSSLPKDGTLANACARIKTMLMPVLRAIEQSEEFRHEWRNGAWVDIAT